MLPLWFNGVPPSKINLGIAYYGRGFTISNKSCVEVGCPYIGGNEGGPCTNTNGVLSLREIQQIVKKKQLTPNLLTDLMVMEVSWDDQWIGYDNDATIALKNNWADRNCLGGTVAWSMDFNSGAGRCVLES